MNERSEVDADAYIATMKALNRPMTPQERAQLLRCYGLAANVELMLAGFPKAGELLGMLADDAAKAGSQ